MRIYLGGVDMTACSGMSRSHTATTWLPGSYGYVAGSAAGSGSGSAPGSAAGSPSSVGSRLIKLQVLSYFLLGLAWYCASSLTVLLL